MKCGCCNAEFPSGIVTDAGGQHQCAACGIVTRFACRHRRLVATSELLTMYRGPLGFCEDCRHVLHHHLASKGQRLDAARWAMKHGFIKKLSEGT